MTSRILYGTVRSGNVYKVRLMLSLLNLPYEFVAIDFAAKAHQSLAFLKLNPLGQIPVLQEGELILRDSQAILVYLARQYDSNWLPTDAAGLAKVMQWLSIAANEIEHSFTALRRHFVLNAPVDQAKAQGIADRLLQVLEDHLQQRQWLECGRPTIADIACFPYINLAEEGRISLSHFPSVLAWLERVRQLPNYISQ
ncbi:glutathione S-transferase [Phormidium tenue FACHB-886]|nr:glutathione S-transferase [Phormidium tenue FACHB-886]